MGNGGRCHPLTILDDHSRYCLQLKACGNERGETVKRCLIETFRRQGMPGKMLMDNGAPWGDSGDNSRTWLTVWLMRLGIEVLHGKPYHPQTQGKEERFHRTLKEELLNRHLFADLAACATSFVEWRTKYNHVRPHEALGMVVPASRYRVSPRPYPEKLPELEYATGDRIRKVNEVGKINLCKRSWRIGRGFAGDEVGIRRSQEEGVWEVRYGVVLVGLLREKDKETKRMEHVPRQLEKAATVATRPPLPPPPSPVAGVQECT